MDSSNIANIICKHSLLEFLKAEKNARARATLPGAIRKEDWDDVMLHGEVLLECLEDENVAKSKDLNNYTVLLSEYIKGKVPNPNIPALFRKLHTSKYPFKISDEVRDMVYRVGLPRRSSNMKQATKSSRNTKTQKGKRNTSFCGSRIAKMKASLNKQQKARRRKKTRKKKKKKKD